MGESNSSTLSEQRPIGESGLARISDVLHFEYSEGARYEIVSGVVKPSGCSPRMKSVRVPTLMDFLLLYEKFYADTTLPRPGFIVLRILSANLDPAGSTATALPILASVSLSPPPSAIAQSSSEELPYARVSVALPTDADVLNKVRIKLLRAVGDPFRHTDLPLRDEPLVSAGDKPAKAIVVLILNPRHRICGGIASAPRVSPPPKGRYPR